jgi:uncharacterized Zn-binding protein involved in type VI secretion
MTNAIHRHGDSRICGATTTVIGQTTVYANNKLVAVNGDTNTHGAGGLIAATKNVYINGKMVANIGDQANQDNLCGVPFQSPLHCNPYATTGSSDVFVGDP